MATIHIAIDEAGNFRFDQHGSRYLILAAAYTYDPAPLALSLSELRFSLLKQGHDLASFHCTEDQQKNRDAVVARMADTTGWLFAGLVIQKNKIHPSIRHQDKLYPLFAKSLIRFVLNYRLRPNTTQIVVCMDRLLTGRSRAGLIKTIHTECAALKPNIQRWIYSHPRESNKWLQVADYCCWAVMKKWEKGDLRTYNQIRHKLTARELDALRSGVQTYY